MEDDVAEDVNDKIKHLVGQGVHQGIFRRHAGALLRNNHGVRFFTNDYGCCDVRDNELPQKTLPFIAREKVS